MIQSTSSSLPAKNSFLVTCSQALWNLVQAVTQAIVHFFQFICHHLFEQKKGQVAESLSSSMSTSSTSDGERASSSDDEVFYPSASAESLAREQKYRCPYR